MEPKVVVFDLFDTLIDVKRYDIEEAKRYLFEHYVNPKVSFERFEEFNNQFAASHFIKREDTNKEYIYHDYLDELNMELGLIDDADFNEIEYRVFSSCNTLLVNDKTRVLLEYYRRKGIPLYILSNSIFGAYALKRRLGELNVLNYFRDVFSSADFGYRKPDKRFFDYALTAIKGKINNIKASDVLFIGNDYAHDVVGAYNAGWTPVYYHHENWETLPDKLLAVRVIKGFDELYMIN
ncbi:MAG: HAD family hydrolase [Bacilli bacterium]|jgi:putative hydrolase of the HAD superfamily